MRLGRRQVVRQGHPPWLHSAAGCCTGVGWAGAAAGLAFAACLGGQPASSRRGSRGLGTVGGQGRGIQRSSQFQRGQADEAQQHGDDPEAHDHLRFFPAALFKVVVQRRHLEQAAAFAVAMRFW